MPVENGPRERAHVAAAIRAFLIAGSPDAEKRTLDETTDLAREWFVDSMAIVSLVAFLETAFGVEVKRADINSRTFRSLRTLTDYVVARHAAREPG